MLTFRVAASSAADQDVSVDYAARGTGASPAQDTDYTVSGTSLLFLSTDTGSLLTKTFDVTIVDDRLDEEEETFLVELGGPVSAMPGGSLELEVTILDDDAEPTVTLSGLSSGSEGETLTFTATLDAISGRAVTVSYGATPDTATSEDYTVGGTGTLGISAGILTASFEVVLVDDDLDEAEEAFTVSLSSASNATLGSVSSLTVRIADTDAPPMVTLSGASGGSESETLTFTATLDAISAKAITVSYGATPDTATSEDYTVGGQWYACHFHWNHDGVVRYRSARRCAGRG